MRGGGTPASVQVDAAVRLRPELPAWPRPPGPGSQALRPSPACFAGARPVPRSSPSVTGCSRPLISQRRFVSPRQAAGHTRYSPAASPGLGAGQRELPRGGGQLVASGPVQGAGLVAAPLCAAGLRAALPSAPAFGSGPSSVCLWPRAPLIPSSPRGQGFLSGVPWTWECPLPVPVPAVISPHLWVFSRWSFPQGRLPRQNFLPTFPGFCPDAVLHRLAVLCAPDALTAAPEVLLSVWGGLGFPVCLHVPE